MDSIETLGYDERKSMSAAAERVKKLIPGPIGEYLSKDLTSMVAMGFRLDVKGLTKQTVDAILSARLPERDV